MADLELRIRITADGRAAIDGTQGVERQVDQLGETAKKVGTLIAAYLSFDFLSSATQALFAAGAALQDFQTRFASLAGSQQAAAAEMAYVQNAAQKLALDLNTARDSYAQLLAQQQAGVITQQQARDLLEGFGRAAQMTGAGADQVSQAMAGLAQALSSGTVSTEDFRQAVDPLPGLMKRFADASGVSIAQLKEDLEKGRVSSADFAKGMITALQAAGKGAEDFSSSLSATWQRVKNQWTLLLETFGAADFLSMLENSSFNEMAATILSTLEQTLKDAAAFIRSGWLSDAFAAEVAYLKGFWADLGNTLADDQFFSEVRANWESLWEEIKDGAGDLLKNFRTVFTDFPEIVAGFTVLAAATIDQWVIDAKAAWEVLKLGFSAAWEAMKGSLSVLLAAMKTAVANAAAEMVITFTQKISELANAVAQIPGIGDALIGIVQQLGGIRTATVNWAADTQAAGRQIDATLQQGEAGFQAQKQAILDSAAAQKAASESAAQQTVLELHARTQARDAALDQAQATRRAAEAAAEGASASAANTAATAANAEATDAAKEKKKALTAEEREAARLAKLTAEALQDQSLAALAAEQAAALLVQQQADLALIQEALAAGEPVQYQQMIQQTEVFTVAIRSLGDALGAQERYKEVFSAYQNQLNRLVDAGIDPATYAWQEFVNRLNQLADLKAIDSIQKATEALTGQNQELVQGLAQLTQHAAASSELAIQQQVATLATQAFTVGLQEQKQAALAAYEQALRYNAGLQLLTDVLSQGKQATENLMTPTQRLTQTLEQAAKARALLADPKYVAELKAMGTSVEQATRYLDAFEKEARQAAEAANPLTQAFTSAAASISDAFANLWVNMLEGNKNAFADFASSIKSIFFKLLAQLAAEAAKGILIKIVAQLSGSGSLGASISNALGGALGGGGSGGFDFGSLLNAGGSLLGGLFGGGGSLAGFLSMDGALSIGGIGISSGIGSAIGAIAAAAPYIAAAIAVVSLLVKAFSGTPHPSSMAVAGGFAPGVSKHGEDYTGKGQAVVGASGIKMGYDYGHTDPKDAEKFRDALLALDKALVELVPDVDLSAAKLGAYGKTTEGFLAGFLADGTERYVDSIEEVTAQFVKDWVGLATEQGKVSKAVNAIMQAMTGDAEDMLKGLAALIAVEQYVKADLAQDAADLLEKAGRSMQETLADMSTAVRDLAQDFDGSSASAQKLAAASQELYKAELQMMLAIQAMIENVAQTAANLIEGIQQDGLEGQELRNYLLERANELEQALRDATTPEDVQKYYNELLDTYKQLWEGMTPEEKAKYKGDWIDMIREMEQLAQEKLEAARQAVIDQHEETAKILTEALEKAATAAAAALEQAAKAAADALTGAAAKIWEAITGKNPLPGGENHAYGGLVGGRWNGQSGIAGDTVLTALTPGEAVIPRATTQRHAPLIRALLNNEVRYAASGIAPTGAGDGAALLLSASPEAIQTLDALTQARYQAEAQAIEAVGAVDVLRRKQDQANAQRTLQIVTNIKRYLDSLELSALSPLTPQQRLAEAESQYQALLARAQGGDAEAADQITQAADAYLQEARQFFASSDAYTAIFSGVKAQLRGLLSGTFADPIDQDALAEQRAALARQLADLLRPFEDLLAARTPLEQALLDSQRSIDAAVEQAQELGASEAQLAIIRAAGAKQAAKLREDAALQMRDFMRPFKDVIAARKPLQQALLDSQRQTDDAIRQAKELGATEAQLAVIRAAGVKQAQKLREDAALQMRDFMRPFQDVVAARKPLQQALLDSQRQTDDAIRQAKELGATEAQLAVIRAAGVKQAQKLREDAALQMRDFMRPFKDVIAARKPLQQALLDSQRQTDDAIRQAKELGATEAQLAVIRAAGVKQAQKLREDAYLQMRDFMRPFQDVLADRKPLQQALIDSARQTEDAIRQAKELGATEAQLALIRAAGVKQAQQLREDAALQMRDFMRPFQDVLADRNPLSQALLDNARQTEDAIRQAKELGATEAQLAIIRAAGVKQAQQLREDAALQMRDFMRPFQDVLADRNPLSQALTDNARQTEEAIRQAKELGATEAQLALIRAAGVKQAQQLREDAALQMRDFMRPFQDVIADRNPLGQALTDNARQTEEAIRQAKELGATEAQLAVIRAAGVKQAQKLREDAALQMRDFMRPFQDINADRNPLSQALIDNARQTDDAIRQAKELGATEAQLAVIRAAGVKQAQKLREDAALQMRDFMRPFQDINADRNPLAQSLIDNQRSVEDAIRQAKELGATEAQLALIRAAGVKQAQKLREDAALQMRDFMRPFQDVVTDRNPLSQALLDNARQTEDAIRQAKELGATEAQLAVIRAAGVKQAQKLREDAALQMRDFMRPFEDVTANRNPLAQSLLDNQRQTDDAIRQAKELGATEAQLALIRAAGVKQAQKLREDAALQMRDFMRPFQDLIAARNPLSQALLDNQRQTDDAIRQAKELGATEAQLATIRAAGVKQAQQLKDDAAQQLTEFMYSYQDVIANRSKVEQALVENQRRIDDAVRQAREMGASEAQIAEILKAGELLAAQIRRDAANPTGGRAESEAAPTMLRQAATAYTQAVEGGTLNARLLSFNQAIAATLLDEAANDTPYRQQTLAGQGRIVTALEDPKPLDRQLAADRDNSDRSAAAVTTALARLEQTLLKALADAGTQTGKQTGAVVAQALTTLVEKIGAAQATAPSTRRVA